MILLKRQRTERENTLLSLATFGAQRILFGLLILVTIAYLSLFGLDLAEGGTLRAAMARAARQTVAYLGRLWKGDLGESLAGSATYATVPVRDVVPGLLGKSLGLLAVSLFLAAAIGVSLGIWAARRRHSGWALVTLLFSIGGVSLPSFFAALLLQLGAIRWTRAFGQPLLPVGGFGWDKRIIMPALVLAARPIAQITRVTYVTVAQVLAQDHVRTAHSKGLPQRTVMVQHVIRNAAIPILTTIGLSLRFSLSSLPVIEYFFNWTGVGFTLLKAIARRDDDMTLALVLSLGALFILVNLLLEGMYRLLDPRLRARTAEAMRQEREGLLAILRSLALEAWDGIRSAPIWRRLRRERGQADPGSPFQRALQQRGIASNGADLDRHMYREERRRSWVRGTVSNVPFVLGALLVLGLLVVVGLGPALTPHSPYTKQGLEYVDGALLVPPFAPSDLYPWGTDVLGRDILSLVMAGAQQTMLLATLVVSARLAIGLVAGAVAGWLSGTWVDRALLGAAEVIAAFPTLLLAMTLVLALGIQRGLSPFVIALSFVGWAEIMQFVRSEVMAIRVRPYIESAVATGTRTARLLWSHVLPNLLPALISLAALEMGAALMLLGELGFVGIFIGGGAFAELQIDAPPYHYSDVPEWGALLSNIRLYARAYPWTALYPASAFTVAILGFNLFGEGIRRMVQTVGIRFSRVVNRYTVAAAVIALLALGWARANTGAIAYYRRQSAAFDGERALEVARALADPALEGRAIGTDGLDDAADQIAARFRALGLQPGGEAMGYYQERTRAFEVLEEEPGLVVGGESPAWAYGEDYAAFPTYYRNMGRTEGLLRIVASGGLTLVQPTYGSSYLKALSHEDVAGSVALVLSPLDAAYLERVHVDALLVVAPDEATVQRKVTLSPRDPHWYVFGSGREVGQNTPALWITGSVADQMLARAGLSVAELRRQVEQLAQDEIVNTLTDVRLWMEVEGTVRDRVSVRNVIGHLPGLSDTRYGGIGKQAIVVLAQYDNPPPGPGATVYPGANDNASGVAVMIEAVRTMQESGYQPYRTFLFIAYSGEGLEGGEEVVASDVRKFLQAHRGFVGNLEVEAIVHLRGLAAGEGDGIVYSALGSRRLAKLMERSASQAGVRARPADESVDLSIVFEERSRRVGGQEAPEIYLSWEGWQATSRQPVDTADTLSAETLEEAGRALSLLLMALGRELQY
ncbi:MAG: ABC transporter permease subunit [Anaerolineae bacterium]|nr:ABC transporter permease subunit [Anaerolineae bacterium]